MKMAITQMQVIQSLGEAMTWFEKELQWGVPPTELRHLSGRIGELYATLITNGQMATEVNQKGYDVVSSTGERISVKTTAMMGTSGHISFNPRTLGIVDRIIVLRINTDEMQIETLLNDTKENAVKLMGNIDSNGKVSISLSKLIISTKERLNIPSTKTVNFESYVVRELENGSVEVEEDGVFMTNTLAVLKVIAKRLSIGTLNGNGNPYNTRQLGTAVIKEIQSQTSILEPAFK